MEITTHRKLNILIGLLGLTSVVISVLVYVESKKDKDIQRELMDLDKQIKELDLAHKKNVVAG